MTVRLSAVDSRRIDALRFPLIVLVVYIHAGRVTTIPSGDNSGLNLLALARIIISDGIARTAVPLFFILSGYFLFPGQQQWSWKIFGEKITRRSRTLLIPYLFWNVVLFAILFVAQLTALRVFFNGDGMLAEMDWVKKLFWVIGFQRYPIAYQLWFIRDLMLLVLISPVLFLLARRVSGALITSAALGFLWMTNIWPIAVPAIEALFFFFVGLSLGIHNRDLFAVPALSYLALAYLALLAVVIEAQGTIFEEPVQHILVLTGIFLSFAAVRALPGRPLQRLAELSGASFFVFAVHEPLLTIFLKLGFRALPITPVIALVIYMTVPFIVVIISFNLHRLSVRFAPETTRYVTGR